MFTGKKSNFNMINRFIASMLIISLMIACKPKDSTEAKKAELEKLKKDLVATQQKITDLEKELKIAPDATAVAKSTISVIMTKDTVFKHYLVVQGKVDSDDNLWLTPKIPGASVINLPVVRGQKVTKGEILATQESGALQESIDQVKNSLSLATTIYKKQKALWDQKIGSEIQYLTAKNNMESAQKNLASLEQQLSLYTLRSPINGTVDDITIKLGEVPTPGMGGIRVVDYTKAKVVADISENYASKINAGDKILINYPDINLNIESTVRTVSKVINASSRTFSIEAKPGDKIENLHPNMISILKINDYTNNKARVVPVNVIQNDESGPFVYIIDNSNGQNIARKKKITAGQTYEGMTEVLAGISDNDKIISSGYQNVVDGQPVNL